MKILSLSINGYKMFNPSPKIILGKDINLLIGVNGSGKSTVLEAIAIIFSEFSRYCEKGGESRIQNFSFSVAYSFTLSETFSETTTKQRFATSINHVVISHSKDSIDDYSMKVDGKSVKARKDMVKFLPDNLIFYYAGFCSTLDNIVSGIYKDWADKLYNVRKPEKQSNVIAEMNKSVIYIKPEYFPLLFLLNYVDEDNKKIALSGKPFNIDEIKFHVSKPDFTTSTDYHNFYNIKGFLGTYLNKLLQDSQDLKPISNLDKKSSDAILTIGYHRSLIDAIESMLDSSSLDAYRYQKYYLFHVICLLFHIGLLKKISVTIKDSDGNIFDISQFSEGEQQLVTIDTINKVLCKGNSVLFFDEPDAFLHPQRQREILPYLKDKFDHRFSDDYVQLIATSHSPFVAQSTDINSILLFSDKGKVKDTFEQALDYKVIANELFGIEKRFNDQIEEKISSFREIRNNIMQDKPIDLLYFKTLVEDINSFGEETSIIINRELAQLKSLKNFDLSYDSNK
jgi:predicted ATPase